MLKLKFCIFFILVCNSGVFKEKNDAEKYNKLGEQVKRSFNLRFFNAVTGIYASGSQTAMAMPLSAGLVDKTYQRIVLDHLIDTIKSHHYELTAGDIISGLCIRFANGEVSCNWQSAFFAFK